MIIRYRFQTELSVTNLKFCSENSLLKNNWHFFLLALTTVQRLHIRHDREHFPRRQRQGRAVTGEGAAEQLLSMRGAGLGEDSPRWKRGCVRGRSSGRMALSSGRGAHFGGRGGSGGGAAVNRGRGGEFNWAGWVPSLELPEQLFIGAAQPLLLLGLLLRVLLQVGVLLRQLSRDDGILVNPCSEIFVLLLENLDFLLQDNVLFRQLFQLNNLLFLLVYLLILHL